MALRSLYVPEPLPGTEPPHRALFVERWGTLLERPVNGYCARFGEARLVPGALDALFQAAASGFTLYLIGNEDAVACGRQSDASWERFERDLLDHLVANGAICRRNYACIDHPAGAPPHDRESVFRLPNTGIFYHAEQHDGIRLSASWTISDDDQTLAAGWRSGCRTVRVATAGAAPETSELTVEVHGESVGLAEFVRSLLARERRAA